MNVALPVILFVVGFAAGGGAIWFILRQRVSEAREQERNIALADIRVAEERAAAKDTTIADLRAEVLCKNQLLHQRNEEDIQLKEQIAILQTRLNNEENKSKDNVKLLNEVKGQFVAMLSEPVTETLEKLNTEITVVRTTATNVGVAASKLVKALQKPEVRGQWGEMALDRVLEVAGLSEGRDFVRQQVIGDDAQRRPDVVIHLVGDKQLAVDAKAPIRAFLEAAETSDEEERKQKLGEFAAHVRDRVKTLGSKSYHQDLESSPEFVVLYLPTEAIYKAAMDLDRDLLEFACRQKVVIAGPGILIALLLAVAHGWKQETLAKHAKDICELGTDLYNRLAVFSGHMSNVGNQLHRSVKAYNEAVGSLESRVMPGARRFEQFGAAPANAQLGELTSIDTAPRKLQSSDFRLDETDGEVEDQEALARPR